MANLDIWEKVKSVPQNAIKPIHGGRLKGMSDINPMWRIKTLTELFGPCGIGWKYTIEKQWIERGGGDEVAAFVNINLHVKYDGEWSEPIPGTGGSMFVAKERNGLYTSDECYKMALTDAISVACKALGVGADVYWSEGTKYTGKATDTKEQPPNWKGFWSAVKALGYDENQVRAEAEKKFGKKIKSMTEVIKTKKQQAEFYNHLKQIKEGA